jgi:hypothetical protein
VTARSNGAPTERSSPRSLAAACARLSFARAVPCDLAHRRALGEVFIADSVELCEGEFLVAMQVPRAHSLWYDRRAQYHDALAILEASRQAVFVIAHRHLDVPRSRSFSLHRIDFRLEDLEAYRDDETSPLEAIWHARLAGRQLQGEIVVGMTMEGTLMIDGASAATLEGEIACLPEKEYEMIRAVQRARARTNDARRRLAHPRRVEPISVGRGDRRNVVIGEPAEIRSAREETHYPLVVDLRHPSFYDHPQDHVPGPLIVEAYRQAAVLTAVRAGVLASPVAAVTGCQATFLDFCEPEVPATCSATMAGGADGRATVSVALHQFDKQIAQAQLELTSYP